MPGKLPKISIITPSLNQGKFIERTIKSVLDQKYPQLEYIVMDGGSTDGTLDILRSYGNRIIWKSAPDNGQSAAINAGIALSSGLVLSWLNSDDTLLPGAVSAAVGALQANPQAGMVYGDTLFTGPDGTPMFPTSTRPFDYRSVVDTCRNPIPQPSTFIRRAACQWLDESLTYFLDWDLWLRIGSQWPILYVPEVWSTYRVHPESKTGRLNYPVGELLYIYRKNFPGIKIPPSVYERMAEYSKANGQWMKSQVLRGRAWLVGI